MFALSDCNNFFASCERVFRPELIGKPVVVLSNNDGCIIARSHEAKALGVPMGAPWHMYKEKFRRSGIHVFSSNFMLYGDLSARVVRVLKDFTPRLEVYSIDESFMDFSGLTNPDAHARHIRSQVGRYTGIPVSIGIAPSKTLAKAANLYAKRNPRTGGVFVMDSSDAQEAVLALTPLEDIWGISGKTAARLMRLGIRSGLDLRLADAAFIRGNFNVILQRLCLELKGQPCLQLEMMHESDRKSIICSRSFGRPITVREDMAQAISSYTCKGAEKLRRSGLVAGQLMVYLQTNYHNKGEPQYHPSQSITLPMPTSDSRKLVQAAHSALARIWQGGFRYKKAGVVFTGLQKPGRLQLSMLDTPDDPVADTLMQAVDGLNRHYRGPAVTLATSGLNPSWSMRAESRSPRYTTHWNELMVAHAR